MKKLDIFEFIDFAEEFLINELWIAFSNRKKDESKLFV